jgi:DNA-nicking Smr family endonuclease
MDFGNILNQWEKRCPTTAYNKDAGQEVKSAANSNSAVNYSSAVGNNAESPAFRRKRLLCKSPDKTLDIHGLTRAEAQDALTAFFNMANNNRLEKVLIIHGKGNHETEGHEPGVLKKLVREFVERCPFAGESGYSSADSGGTGSTWVLLKNYRSR